jgi:hypothetical protein
MERFRLTGSDLLLGEQEAGHLGLASGACHGFPKCALAYHASADRNGPIRRYDMATGDSEQGFPRYRAVQTNPQATEKKSKAGRNEIIFGIIAAGAGLALMVNSVTVYTGARDDIEIAPRFWGGLACAGLGAYLIVHGARRDNAAIALPLAGGPNSRLEVSLGRGAGVQYRRGW